MFVQAGSMFPRLVAYCIILLALLAEIGPNFQILAESIIINFSYNFKFLFNFSSFYINLEGYSTDCLNISHLAEHRIVLFSKFSSTKMES